MGYTGEGRDDVCWSGNVGARAKEPIKDKHLTRKDYVDGEFVEREVYGSYYIHEGNITVALTKDVYTHLTGFTAGVCKNIDCSTDEIIIEKTGIYLVTWSVSSKTASANQLIDFDLFVNDIEIPQGSARRSFGTANATGNIAGTAIIALNAEDSMDLRAKNNTSDADIILFNAGASINKISN